MSSLEKPVVLIADSNPRFVAVAKARVETLGYDVLIAPDAIHAVRIFQESITGPMICVVAEDLRDMGGQWLLKYIEDNQRYPTVSIYTSKKKNDEIFGSGLDMDCLTYFCKVPPHGGPAYNLGTLFDKHVMHAERFLEKQQRSGMDRGAGTINEQGGMERWKIEWTRMQRRKSCLSMIVLDMNGLSDINNLYSHSAGTAAIRAFVTMLRKHTRSIDFIFRKGRGDEFVIVLPETPKQEARKVYKRIKHDEVTIEIVETAQPWKVSFAIGVATMGHDDLISFSQEYASEENSPEDRMSENAFKKLFAEADADMYADKFEYYKGCAVLTNDPHVLKKLEQYRKWERKKTSDK